MEFILKKWLEQCEYDDSTQLSFDLEDIESRVWKVFIGEQKIDTCLPDSMRLEIKSILDEHPQHIRYRLVPIGEYMGETYQLKSRDALIEMRRIINGER